MSENRTGKRFGMKLPVSIKSTDSLGEVEGYTDNVSTSGIYLHATSGLRVGSKIKFEITLPPDVTGAKTDVKLQCQGTVVRAEEKPDHDGRTGVACVIDGYEFVRSS